MTPPTRLILHDGGHLKNYIYMTPPCIVKWGHFTCNLLRTWTNCVFYEPPYKQGDIGVISFVMSFYDPPYYNSSLIIFDPEH